MIDKISLTTFYLPDWKFLAENWNIIEDQHRARHYKYLCRLDKATVLFHPHKYSEIRNMMMAQTKIDLNPKDFDSYEEMLSYVFMIFKPNSISINDLKITRIDVS